MALDTDIDDQDQAETFDEETSGADNDLETDYILDRNTQDFTSARGDADVDGDDEALDADELDDEALDEIDDAGEEDDLDDEGADVDALASDDIPDFSSDRDFAEPGDDEAAATSAGEVETVAMGDMTDVEGASSVADLESDRLSDDDLKELDYMEDDTDAEGARTEAGDPSAPTPDNATVRPESERLDEGLEETFPASDPVSAKHIT